MSVTVIKPHVQNNSDCYIIADGKKFAIVMGEDYSYTFTEKDSENIVKAITSFDTTKIIRLMKMGRSVGEKNIITIPCEKSTIDDTILTYQFINIEVSAAPFNLWSSRIFTDGLVINLPVGVIDDLYKYLISQGIQPAKGYGTYSKIEYVEELPTPKYAVPETAYILIKEYDDKKAGSAWVYNGRRYDIVTDEDIIPDPNDPLTIPDTPEKEEVNGVISDVGTETAEVWNKTVTAKSVVNATESVSVINSVIDTGSLAITIQ